MLSQFGPCIITYQELWYVHIYVPICTFVVCICRHVHCSLFILISIDTYQLRSCDISSIDDNITYKCSYGNQSVLWGCGIEAVNIMNGDTNTSNTTSDNGVINGLCDGIYNVTCYGIPDTNPSTRIIYNDSKHHSLISITGSMCVVSSSSMVEPSLTPTNVPVSTECNGNKIFIKFFLN